MGTAGAELLDWRRRARLPRRVRLLVRLELLRVQGARPVRPAEYNDRRGCRGGGGSSRLAGIADVARGDRAVRCAVVWRRLLSRHPVSAVSLGRGETVTRPVVVHVLLPPVGVGQ